MARDRFVAWCGQAGCNVSIDNAGNIFALRPGLRDAPVITTGRHLDTQPAGGRFDGIYGVLAGLEIVRTLNDGGVETEFPIAVVNWTNEEGVRYPGLLGSQAFTGRWTPQELKDLQSIDGSRFGADLQSIGYGGGPILRFPMQRYFELHIEQGPILEKKGDLIGIVTHVQGLRWFDVIVRGANRHAGTTPMDTRSDALVAAAEIIARLAALGRQHAPDARITVGRVTAEPNSPSTIAGLVRFVIDLRHPESAALDSLENQISVLGHEIACSNSTEFAMYRTTTSIEPIEFDEGCIACLENVAATLGLPHRRMISGALHDAAVIGRLVPSAMVFVPSRDGISHDPAEWSEPSHIEAGCNVLLHAMLTHAGAVTLR